MKTINHSKKSCLRFKSAPGKKHTIIALIGLKAAKTAVLALLLTGSCESISAFNIKGRVLDATDASAIEGANWKIYQLPDTLKAATYGVTDKLGAFNSQTDIAGDFRMLITYTGKKDYQIDFSLSSTSPEVDLGAVALQDNAEMLGEVTVVATRPVIQADGEKVTYNADADAAAQSQSAIEMLRKVPMITVDGDDNIRLNGQGDFKIYVNGRPDPMMSANASQVLKSMPASSISRVEVITEPGAKYDAEGVGGIINIITVRKQRNDGYTAIFTAGANNRNANISASATTKVNKVTTSLGLSWFDMYQMKAKAYGEQEYFGDTPVKFMRSKAATDNKANFLQGNFQLSYEADSLNLFTASASLFSIAGNGDIGYNVRNFGSSGAQISGFNSRIHGNMKMLSVSANAAYQHTFGKDGHDFILSYQYNYGRNANDFYTDYLEADNYNYTAPSQREHSITPTHEHTVQADYTNPFNGVHKLEAGAKAVFRRNTGINDFYFGPSDNNLTFDEGASLTVRQTQNVAAAYASYSLKLGKFGAKAGLRYEHTNMGLKYLRGTGERFSTKLNDLVPNAALSYNFTMMRSLRLAYQMRITRPSIDQVDPYRNTFNPTEVKFGNPDLTSERNHNITLTYSDFAGFVGMNFSAGYSQSHNMIEEVTWTDNNILYQSYDNIGTYRRFFFNGFLNFMFGPKLRFSLNGSANYTDYKYESAGLGNCGWSGNAGASLSYTMPWKVNMEASGGWGSKSPTLQGYWGDWSYYTLSFKRSFLAEDRLSVTLTASNFANRHTVWSAKTENADFCLKSRNVVANWTVGASISFTFGNMKSSVKKVGTSIENDDVKSSSSGQGAQGGGIGL